MNRPTIGDIPPMYVPQSSYINSVLVAEGRDAKRHVHQCQRRQPPWLKGVLAL